MLIRGRSTRVSQPTGLVEIDTSNPLTLELVSLPLFSAGAADSARQFTPTLDSGVTEVAGIYGRALRGTTAAAGFNLTAGTGFNGLISTSSPFTVMILMRVATVGSRRIFFADFSSGGVTESICMEQQEANTWRFYQADSGGSVLASSGAGVTVGWHWVEFGWNGSVVQGVVDAVPLSSAAAVNPRRNGTDLRAMRAGALTSLGFDGDFAFLGVWRRFLSDVERIQIRENPWQLYRPRESRAWFSDVGGASQSIAFTLEDVSASVSQNLSHAQSLSGTLDDVTVSISQTAQHSQALDATLDGVTVAASQTLSHSQALAATLDGVTVDINQSAAPSSKDQSLAVTLDSIAVSIAQEGPANLIDTHDGFWAKEWARIRAREKRKYQEEIQERVEEIQDEIAEVEQQIVEVKQAPKPKKATPARDFYAEQARIVEHLIARRNQLIDEEDEELLLLL